MAKIDYVKAWGLWSHFESVFNLSKGLTVVTGPNGSGKTTLIRIVKWVGLGEPSGERFIFTLTDEATGEVVRQAEEGKAEIGLDNGVVITKTRRKGKTTYTISTIAEPFEKSEVPQEIKDALGINKHKFGDFETYLNFAFQLEAPFLLSESPSVGAKVLGKLAGTEAVDLAIGAATKQLRGTQRAVTASKQEVEKINGDLLAYADLDDLQQQLKACEYLVEELDKDATKRQNLAELANRLLTARNSLEELEADLDKLAIVPELDVDLQDVEAAQKRYDMLIDTYGRLNTSLSTIDELTDQLVAYQCVDAAATIMGDLEKVERRLDAITRLSTNLASYTQTIKAADEFLQTTKDIDVAADHLARDEKHALHMDKLKTLYGEHTTASGQVLRLSTELAALAGVTDAAAILEAVDAELGRLHKFTQLLKEYQLKRDIANSAGIELTAAAGAYKKAEAELTEAWDEAGGVCPLCDQAISTHTH